MGSVEDPNIHIGILNGIYSEKDDVNVTFDGNSSNLLPLKSISKTPRHTSNPHLASTGDQRNMHP